MLNMIGVDLNFLQAGSLNLWAWKTCFSLTSWNWKFSMHPRYFTWTFNEDMCIAALYFLPCVIETLYLFYITESLGIVNTDGRHCKGRWESAIK